MRLRRMIHQIARRAWAAATKKVHKDFDIVWVGNRWRVKGVFEETRKAKAVKNKSPRTRSIIEIVFKPEFAGSEHFSEISIGEIFEYDRHYYKKLPYELSRMKKQGEPMGLAINLFDEGVYHFNAADDVLACDVQCHISYVHSRQTSVLERYKS